MHGVKLKLTKTVLGEPDKAGVFFGHSVMGQTADTPSPIKLGDFNFLQEAFSPHPDMKMVEDIDAVFVDTLGCASMDSFTDLSSLLIEPSFLEQPDDKGKEEDANPSLTLLDMDQAMKHQQQYSAATCPNAELEAEDSSSDLAQLSVKVGLKRSRAPSLDHDYSTKRARLSPSPMPASVESGEESFLVPDFSPASSPSPSVSSSSASASTKDRQQQRREKNNLASKRSREIRKTKFKNMEVEAQRLCQENARLERRVAELQKLAKDMQGVLVRKLKIKT